MAAQAQSLSFAIRAINEAKSTLAAVQKDIGDVGIAAEKSGGRLGGMGGALGGVAKIASGFVVGAGLLQLPGLLGGAAKAAAEDEAATLRMGQALTKLVERSGGAEGSVADLTKQMNDRILAGQKLAFGDDQVRDSMQQLIAATDSFAEAEQRQVLAMDLARGANIPLAEASKLLGKVNSENVEVFKRMGITIGEGATEAEALAAVQAKFGGQADTYAKSTAGQFEQAKIRMGEVNEQIGTVVLPIMAKLGTTLVNDVFPMIERFVDAVGPVLSRIGTWIAENILPRLREFGEFFTAEIAPRIREFAQVAGEKFQEFRQYYLDYIWPVTREILEGYRAIVQFVVDNWPTIWTVIGPIVAQLQNSFTTFFGAVFGLIDAAIKLLNGDFAGAWNALGGVVQTVWDGIVATVRNAANLIVGIMNGLIKAWNALSFSVDLPGLDAIHVGTPDLPLIPTLAKGGIVTRPTLALIGEAGPEAIVPLSRAGTRANAVGATTNIYLTITEPLSDASRIEEAVHRAIAGLQDSGRIAAGTAT